MTREDALRELLAKGWLPIAGGAPEADETTVDEGAPAGGDEVVEEQPDETPDWADDLDADVPDDEGETPTVSRDLFASVRSEAARRRVENKAYRELGTPEELRRRLTQSVSLDTPDGQMEAFFRAGRSLGIGDRELSAILMGEFPQPQQPSRGRRDDDYADEDDEDEEDRPLTRRELLEIMQQQQQQMVQQQQLEARNQLVFQAIDTELDSLGIKDNAIIREFVLNRATQMMPPGSWDPNVARDRIRRAHAEVTDALGLQPAVPNGDGQNGNGNGVNDYTRRKARAAAQTPVRPRGGSGGVPINTPPPEPEDWDEMQTRLRDYYRRQGIEYEPTR